MHDKNGKAIKVGDRVTVEFTVEQTSSGEDYCNVMVKTVEPFWPDESRRDTSWINSKQCIVVEPPESASDDECEGDQASPEPEHAVRAVVAK